MNTNNRKTKRDTLQQALKRITVLSNRLDLILRDRKMCKALDKSADAAPGLDPMLASQASLLAEHLEVDVCEVFLLDRETGKMEVRATHDQSKRWGAVERAVAQELAAQAVQRAEVMVRRRNRRRGTRGTGMPMPAHLVAVPIITEGRERLGAILVARWERPFRTSDLYLLKSAEDEIDSDITHQYAMDDNKQGNKELEALIRVDHICDQDWPLSEILNAVVREVAKTTEAEMGFIMLYDQARKDLAVGASTCQYPLQSLPYYSRISAAARQSLNCEMVVRYNHLKKEPRSIMCQRMAVHDRVLGVVGVVNRMGPRGFTAADWRLLDVMRGRIDSAIADRSAIAQLRGMLKKSVGPRVFEEIERNPDLLKSRDAVVTALFNDMRDFTVMTGQHGRKVMQAVMSDVFTLLTEVAFQYDGWVNKFLGDGALVICGALVPQEDHALRTIRIALDFFQRFPTLVEHWMERGVDLREHGIGIGIAMGDVAVGEMGSRDRPDFTAFGMPVILAARLCAYAGGGQIIISQPTYDLVQNRVDVEPREANLKGIGLVKVYRVLALKGEEHDNLGFAP